MTRYLLDTGPLAAYLMGRESVLPLVTSWMSRGQAATSILVYGEITEYIKGLPGYHEHHEQLQAVLRIIVPYFLTYSILERYADIRRQLRPPHGPGLIGDIDTLIAATALEHDLTIVTYNAKHFERVLGLKIYPLSAGTQKKVA